MLSLEMVSFSKNMMYCRYIDIIAIISYQHYR